MGQIVGLNAKCKRANLNALSLAPTPANGEIILVSSDNSMTADGQGNFDCYIVGDGHTAPTALELKKIDDVHAEYVDNPDFVMVYTDAEDRILFAIKVDGDILFGAGVPTQVKEYIEEKISSLSLDEYENIVSFLSDYLGSDTTLKAMIDSINERIPEIIDNPEFIQVTTDAEGKIIDGIRKDGTKVEPCNVEYPNGIPSGITEYVENRIDQTSRRIAPFNSVPEYYFDNNYLDNKVESINKTASKGDTDTFIFITDEHFERNAQVSPTIINYLEKKTLFSKIISAGDHVHLVNETGKAEINKAAFDFIYSFNHCSKSPFYPAIGNHEFLTGRFQSGTFDGVELWKWAYYLYYTNLNGISLGDKEKMYYYLDDNVKKMRYIFLSAYTPYENEIPEGEGYQRVATSAYDDAQIQWFRDVALNVEEGYGIIIITHELAGITAGNQQSDDNLTISCGSYLYKRVANVILNYHGSGTIICVLAGHTHRDGIVLFDDEFVGNTGESVTNNAFFQITSTCDANDFTGMASEMLVNRESGTINEGAFDFCIINRVEEKLNLIRIGAKTDINYHYTGTIEEREVNFGIKNVSVGDDLTINTDLQGTVTWQSSRPNIATISDGVVHGVSQGFAQISALNSEKAIVYLVKVN